MGLRVFTKEEEALRIGSVRQRLLDVINIVAPTTEESENIQGWLDDLDFVEIIIEVEQVFDVVITEGNKRINDFEKVKDLIDWLEPNVA